MRILIAVTLLLLLSSGCSSQSQRAAAAESAAEPERATPPLLWANSSRKRSPAFHGDPVKPREDWFYYQRAYPLADVPARARSRALQQAARVPEARRGDSTARATAASPWELVGPVGFTSVAEPSWGTMSGRVRAIAVDPGDANRLFLGTATGGVWRSLDAGATWAPLTDTEDSLAIGAVAIDPQDANTIYAGTGEGNGTYFSVGILKSVDGGDNWVKLAENEFSRGQIVDILVSPDLDPDPDAVVACAKDGGFAGGIDGQTGQDIGPIYRSTDGGANFTLLGPVCYCRSLAADPSNFRNQYFSASGCLTDADNGIWKSTDAGATWNQLVNAPSGADVGRLDIGLSSDGATLYVGGNLNTDPNAAPVIELHRSVDSGANWTQLNPNGVDADMDGTIDVRAYCGAQCGYDNVITVNPADATDVFAGGVGLYRSADSGANFVTVSPGSPPPLSNTVGGPLHVDHHVLHFVPGTNVIYNGNDGGLYKSTDGGANWTALGAQLSTIQAHHVSLHPTNRDIFFQGNQDNGTTRRTNSNLWSERDGGDGAYSVIHPTNPQIVYWSTQALGAVAKSLDGGETFIPADNGLPAAGAERRNFVAPLVMDQQDPDTLYAGTFRLWRTTDGGANWAARSPDLTGGNVDANVTSIAVAPSDSNVIYATTSNGRVQRSADAGASFIDSTSAPLPGRYATNVVVHPTDPNTAYAAFSGFDEATPGNPGHVFRTTDGGTTWADVSGNLPNIPVNVLAIRPNVPNEIYAGSDAGVYITSTSGTTWAQMNSGLPNAGVLSLGVDTSTNILVAATYGRSTWRAPLDPSCAFAFDLVLANETVGTPDTRRACNTIRAGTNFQVSPSGDLAFIAGLSVTLENGFQVGLNGKFRAEISP